MPDSIGTQQDQQGWRKDSLFDWMISVGFFTRHGNRNLTIDESRGKAEIEYRRLTS